ncbi:hypothetical protein L1077_05630 [Pseudoalteromonas luteoviolacea]|uniref:Uncharacterized protein n=1 Tax=Pseudoalteromonas luteoviolacea H33 TaxID=1365251 RepID=A0A167CXR5_9GAMM|nr:hypothetical protein [Pseudoalteromonas luteoviolacea]KZN48186.1 hypothetical protein N476_22290 [Pseudoalteromonas luteoviolacea H33]KZN78200.1 hypothetical protein N477_10065 [Pseudoalteromonas luteoviolacea H33-S]MBQ4876649.1 hypothetical protein [Pseudoalteromonas luteoviolacea]MBQ4905562.1 hypothetical protein [Pseudoalteromonas luteoviolacea]MCF6438901.1 hypothetical protein [Pseudoalteromonas luteoviolacea]
MKKRYLLAIAASALSFNSFASSVSCYVDTMAFDEYREGSCWGGEHYPGFSPNVAFKVNADKPVSKVDWVFSGRYSNVRGGTCSSTTCLVDVYQGEGEVTACVNRIYYKDYTWKKVNWCANAFYYYTDGGIPH